MSILLANIVFWPIWTMISYSPVFITQYVIDHYPELMEKYVNMNSPIEHHDENCIELFCHECSAEFTIEHELGLEYIPHFCTFCGEEIYREEEIIDYEDEKEL